ncbi:MAG: hypothetical protein IJR14_04945 [Synergistaceae bacterium]|nr:hypothetical protein [Synergistaceae bacterium]
MFQDLFIDIYADQELTTDCADLRALVGQRILQGQSPEPLFERGVGGAREVVLAHIANAALDVLNISAAKGESARHDLHGQEVYKVYRCALYRLKDAGLISDETAKRMIHDALVMVAGG